MSYCINPETKEHLIEAIENVGISDDKSDELKEFIKSLDKCTPSDATKSKKGKRPLSKYNLFMSKCLKEKDMKSCVKDYHIIKKNL